jgi:capsular polysaccharide transport system permease protein
MSDGLSVADVTRAQGRLLLALMLRDIKTRFGGSEWGFLLAIAWPLSHILILIAVNRALGRAAPYGDSPALFYATGVIPFMAFSYMSRFIMMGIALNKPLLSFNAVKASDILFARAIVEILNAALVILILFCIFWACDIDFMPVDVPQACLALLAMMLLGVGMGVINAIIAAAIPMWITGYALLTIIMWFASGVILVPDTLPEQVRNILAYFPPLQGVEWMRSAYYDGFGELVLDRTYLVSVGLCTLFVGLLLERIVRGRLLV